jgi:hypothetical protein
MKGNVSSMPAMTIPATSTGVVVQRNFATSMPAATMPATVAGLQSYAASERTDYPGGSGSIQPLVQAKVLSSNVIGPSTSMGVASVAGSTRVTVASVPQPPPLPNVVQSSVISATQGSGLVSQCAMAPMPCSQVISPPSITATSLAAGDKVPLHSSRIMTTSGAHSARGMTTSAAHSARDMTTSGAYSASMVQSFSGNVPPAPPATSGPLVHNVISPRSPSPFQSQPVSPLTAGMQMTASPPVASLPTSNAWQPQGISTPSEEDAWFAVGSPSVRVEPAWREGRWWLSAAVDFRGLEKLPLGSKQAILCVADEALEQMECQGSLPQLPAPASWDDRGCPIS